MKKRDGSSEINSSTLSATRRTSQLTTSSLPADDGCNDTCRSLPTESRNLSHDEQLHNKALPLIEDAIEFLTSCVDAYKSKIILPSVVSTNTARLWPEQGEYGSTRQVWRFVKISVAVYACHAENLAVPSPVYRELHSLQTYRARHRSAGKFLAALLLLSP